MDSRLKQHPLGFWEVKDKPTSVELQQYYADKYYQEAKGSYALEYTQSELSYFQAKLEQRLAIVQHLLTATNNNINLLDVGCGEGYALAFFKKLGWNIKGIDFSSAGVESKNPQCLDALTTGDIFNLINQEIDGKKRYDVIWLQNVLEHVISPLDLLESLKQLLKPDGLLVVTVPNDCSIVQKTALEKNHIDTAFWVAPPDHLSYFNYDSLISTSEATGWSCLEIIADFPIDWFLYHQGSNYVNDKKLGKKAHLARVELENVIHQRPIKDVLAFWSAAAKLGVGRDLTAFLRPNIIETTDE